MIEWKGSVQTRPKTTSQSRLKTRLKKLSGQRCSKPYHVKRRDFAVRHGIDHAKLINPSH